MANGRRRRRATGRPIGVDGHSVSTARTAASTPAKGIDGHAIGAARGRCVGAAALAAAAASAARPRARPGVIASAGATLATRISSVTGGASDGSVHLDASERDGDGEGERPDGRRDGAGAGGDLFHNLERGGAADAGGVMGASREPEHGEVSA